MFRSIVLSAFLMSTTALAAKSPVYKSFPVFQEYNCVHENEKSLVAKLILSKGLDLQRITLFLSDTKLKDLYYAAMYMHAGPDEEGVFRYARYSDDLVVNEEESFLVPIKIHDQKLKSFRLKLSSKTTSSGEYICK